MKPPQPATICSMPSTAESQDKKDPGKPLSALIDALSEADVRGKEELYITGIVYDSRKVMPGNLFAALSGIHVDGHNYIKEAIERGASAILHERSLSAYNDKVTYIKVPDSRRALSPISSAFYDHPSRSLFCIGVTGTDGKSTTVFFMYQLLRKLGVPAGFLSTVHFNTDGKTEKNNLRQSTPEAPEIHALLRKMADAGLTTAVIEATSHGLSQENYRLGDVAFRGAVFTNLGEEHLEFHKTLKRYRDAKGNLFRALEKQQDGFAVVNSDDPQADYFIGLTGRPVLTYSASGKTADLRTLRVKEGIGDISAVVEWQNSSYPLTLPMPGSFNLENAMAALLTVHRLSALPMANIVPRIEELEPVPGRMHSLLRGQPFHVLVDYAHTPGSFQQLFPMLKRQLDTKVARKGERNKLIALFGSAGERDRKKRPRQGQIASQYADIIVLTDEDPRGEDPGSILEEIAAGCGDRLRGEDLYLIHNRKDAIKHAFSLATEGDLVVLLGKGHESSIMYEHGSIPWDESRIAESILKEMGYGDSPSKT